MSETAPGESGILDRFRARPFIVRLCQFYTGAKYGIAFGRTKSFIKLIKHNDIVIYPTTTEETEPIREAVWTGTGNDPD